ncbi:MAG: 50S ribosomal protein L18 [Bacilli bacterium]|nr:50S ribosomal protein L18 [Bacilli bacterium]
MIKKQSRNEMRKVRHQRIRETLSGTTNKPRLNVFRSNKHISAQIIDDEKGITLVSTTSTDKKLNIKNGGNIEAAKIVGADIAKKAIALKIQKVIFDRSGYLYHGRVKALAEAARDNGLEF